MRTPFFDEFIDPREVIEDETRDALLQSYQQGTPTLLPAEEASELVRVGLAVAAEDEARAPLSLFRWIAGGDTHRGRA